MNNIKKNNTYKYINNHLTNDRNQRNSFNLVNTKRTIIPSLSFDWTDDNNKMQKKHIQHSLSYINNKSSDLLSPNHYNPLINYRNENENENQRNKSIISLKRNPLKDNLDHMMPISEPDYRRHFKKSIFGEYNKSHFVIGNKERNRDKTEINDSCGNNGYKSIYNLKGIRRNYNGKKNGGNPGIYCNGNGVSNQNVYSTIVPNIYRKKYLCGNYNINYKYMSKEGNDTYYFDNPEISYKNYVKNVKKIY